jgi:glycosyltransferase involved in cell wall biosynthesis
MSQEKPQAIGRLTPGVVVMAPLKLRDTLRNLELEHLDKPTFELIGLRGTTTQHNSFRVFDPIQLHQLFSRIRPDVVCVEQEPYSLSTYQVLRLKKKFGFKVVLLSMQNLFKTYPPPFNWIERYCLKRIDLFLAASSSVLPVWLKKGLPENRCRVLPQVGVSLEEFKPMPAQKEKFGFKKFTFGYAGRFVEEKGVQILIEAFARMKNRTACQLVLFGRGPYEPALRELARKLGMENEVAFLPGVKHHEVPSVLNAFDIMVLPSLVRPHWKEQFGHIIIEAQACGIPVLGSDCDPIPDVMGEGGVSFKTESVESLVASMDKLVLDPVLRRQLTERALQNVKQRFTNERIAEQFLAMIEEFDLGPRTR